MIKISNLSKSFDGQNVLNGIDLEVKEGEVVAIIGPSGTGKSTFLRCINYLEQPDTGLISVDGLTVDAQSHQQKDVLALRRKLSFVFQNYSLFANLNSEQNIAEALITVWKQPKDKALAEARKILKDIGLADKTKHYPSQLSGGQQQRIGIGRAMATHSQAILFDEPTSALDPEWVGEVLELIKKLAERKQTLIIVTHEMAFAREVADRVVFMSDGTIVEQGSPEELFNQPKDPRTQQFISRIVKRNHG
ncbi:ATP-binding cassette domain-containing protein [Agarivorans sp. B2Z047]|uniref:amino acid ABC transporter ATP-binding protein n=1 Tax=Agarivorans sp. B2Z047 TaxID=2652721 RepID=UPI00128D2F4B|nr:amino acid ABC transporter ATP-binding protein [Agarivorans sp. B2Z047]MPW31138.1 ATP-binding cassette domain-containing protein [Agarivorans sp. B2Z047]UQN42894.1 amino acid ABC transporter ATP-binding protein [Agarivorans sp. B2Z047]